MFEVRYLLYKTKDLFLKFYILSLHIRSEYYNWKGYIWNGDLDSHMCCDGRACGCEGITIRDSYLESENENL